MSRVFERDGFWWIDFRDAQGVRHRRKVAPNKRVAQEVLDGILGNVARRVHLGVIEDSPISFADFASVWWKRVAHTLKPRTQERWQGILNKHLKPAFPGALRAITAAAAESYIARRVENKASASTINREVTVLKHMFKRAVMWEYLSNNPIAGMKDLREPAGRARFLGIEEIDQLLNAFEWEGARSPLVRHYLKPLALVAMNTGMRRNEILGLTRRSVDWSNRVVPLEETKNDTPRPVFLNDVALDALRSLPARLDTDRLFPFSPNQVTMAFRRVVKRAGISDFRFHDLRHTFASYQAMSGVAARGLQALLGHKDARMTMRYSHLSDAYLRDAVNNVVLGRQTGSRDGQVGTSVAPRVIAK
jgi:integrase